MRITQTTFSKGEVSPLLHARTDLTMYASGLAELKNMIVLPQGGVTRRAGISSFAAADSSEGNMKLIPFEYNSSDACLLQFTGRTLKVWAGLSVSPYVAAEIPAPYSISDVQGLRYVQSGNVVFLAHRNYKPKMLTRHSLTSWTLEDFPFHGGPFIDGADWDSSAKLHLSGQGDTRLLESEESFFTDGLTGTLVKLDYAVQSQTETLTATGQTPSLEVKGTLNVQTTGKWTGEIKIDRSSDGGETWVTIRQYKRTDIDEQGQWDFTVSETESYVLYRVKYDSDSATENEDITVTVTASGFLKSEIYKITAVNSSLSAFIQRQKDLGFVINDTFTGRISLWSIGAWGISQGYPSAVSMYQDRLVFSGSRYQPQTIWLSRTADYADFSVSDPLRDDDAVTITLAGSMADGIHSLLATTDLLAFTSSGEWKISGAGDAGAITPSALTAHQQTTIGSKNIQPVLADGRIVLVQAQGRKVYALGYDLNTDGYAGSEISILSDHMFIGRTITGMAYQKIPDSLLWFVLDDGSFVSCTFVPEHEVTGWARHSSACFLYQITAVSGTFQTEIIAVGGDTSGLHLVKFLPRYGGVPVDTSGTFESVMRTLRLTLAIKDKGNNFSNRKFVPRVIVSALNSSQAWIAPGALNEAEKNWDRRRKITWNYANYLTDADVQLDNGFDEYACVQIRSIDSEPLTIAAITPILTGG